jgi:hypothetical protein
MSLNVGSTIPSGQYGEGRNAMGSERGTWETCGKRGKRKSGKAGKSRKSGIEKAESGIEDGRPGSPKLIPQNESLGR